MMLEKSTKNRKKNQNNDKVQNRYFRSAVKSPEELEIVRMSNDTKQHSDSKNCTVQRYPLKPFLDSINL